jgi:hypothetical protein
VKIIRSIAGVPIRLTRERFAHIAARHPEMTDQQDCILETINQPDYVQEGDSGTLIAVKSYPKTPLSEKSCAVVYRELSDGDGFVVTAYFTSRPAVWRRIIWKL